MPLLMMQEPMLLTLLLLLLLLLLQVLQSNRQYLHTSFTDLQVCDTVFNTSIDAVP